VSTVLYVGNDMAVRIVGLREGVTGSWLNNQTLSGELCDAAGDPLDTPVTFDLDYEAGSDGNYVGLLPATANVADGTAYRLVIDADGGPGLVGHWEFAAIGKRREVQT
jgi:hypothetical protein